MGSGSGIRNPEKNLFRIPGPGPRVKKAPDPGSGSATLPHTLASSLKLSLLTGKRPHDEVNGLCEAGGRVD
jgi:hypothetical protein